MTLDKLSVEEGQHVLILWGEGNLPERLKDAVDIVSQKIGATGKVLVEHIDRLSLSNHPHSTFDAVVSGYIPPFCTQHKTDTLVEAARILKPGGSLFLCEPVAVTTGSQSNMQSMESLQRLIKLSGFINLSEPKQLTASSEDTDEVKSILKHSNDVSYLEFTAKKPDYEVGSSSQLKLSFATKPVEKKVDDKAAQVWMLSANDMMDDDVDIMDSDDLLDEDDLKKPDPASLRAADCGDGPKKKKACKNCTCGLAEELDMEAANNQKAKTATSACGSCYLGDAFRCASCPYLGMPAFKPGEKIALSDRQLNADQ